MWYDDRLHGDLFSDSPKLGIGLTSTWPPDYLITEPLDGVEEDQNLNSTYVLSGPQRELLKTGAVKNRRERNNRILEKRDKLPERIQNLTEDIALLCYRSIFSEENWESGVIQGDARGSSTSPAFQALSEANSLAEARELDPDSSESDDYETPFESPADLWEELLATPWRTQSVRKSVFFHGNPVFSQETQLGFEIGNVLRMLRPDSYESYFDHQWESGEEVIGGGLIWGFILAYVGESAANLDEERQRMVELFDRLLELQEERQSEAQRMPNRDELENAQYEQVTKDAVEQADLPPEPTLLREVEYHCDRHYDSLDDEETKRMAAQSVVEQIVDTTPLSEVDALVTLLSEDLHLIRDKGKSGVESVRLALEPIWNSAESNTVEAKNEERGGEMESKSVATSNRIAREIGESQAGISAVLNRVSTHDESPCWTNEVVVRRRSGGERGTEWRLTEYGSLLCYIEFKRDGDLDWLYHYAIGPEELSLLERKLVLEAIDDVLHIT